MSKLEPWQRLDQPNDTYQIATEKYKLSDYKVYADNQQIPLEGQLSLLGNEVAHENDVTWFVPQSQWCMHIRLKHP